MGGPALLPDTTFLKYAVPVKPDPHPSAIWIATFQKRVVNSHLFLGYNFLLKNKFKRFLDFFNVQVSMELNCFLRLVSCVHYIRYKSGRLLLRLSWAHVELLTKKNAKVWRRKSAFFKTTKRPCILFSLKENKIMYKYVCKGFISEYSIIVSILWRYVLTTTRKI